MPHSVSNVTKISGILLRQFADPIHDIRNGTGAKTGYAGANGVIQRLQPARLHSLPADGCAYDAASRPGVAVRINPAHDRRRNGTSIVQLSLQQCQRDHTQVVDSGREGQMTV